MRESILFQSLNLVSSALLSEHYRLLTIIPMTTIFLFNFWAEIFIALNSFRLQSFIRALLLFKIRLNKRGLFVVLNAKFDLPVIVVLFNNATAKITLINY